MEVAMRQTKRERIKRLLDELPEDAGVMPAGEFDASESESSPDKFPPAGEPGIFREK